MRNFINLSELHALIAHEVTAAPLPAHLKPPIGRLLRHVLPSLPLGLRDVARAGDPAWAHRAARADQPLFRLDDRARRDARAAIRAVLLDVETLVEIAARPGHPHASACARCLRGIDHWRNLRWIGDDRRSFAAPKWAASICLTVKVMGLLLRYHAERKVAEGHALACRGVKPFEGLWRKIFSRTGS